MTTKGFTVSHLRDGKFERGLRPYLEYRYLGIKEATEGRVVAWHLRAVPPAPFTGGEPHVHRTTFQMVYVLKGWIEFEYEEKGWCVLRPEPAYFSRPRYGTERSGTATISKYWRSSCPLVSRPKRSNRSDGDSLSRLSHCEWH